MASVCGPHCLDLRGRGRINFRHSGNVLSAMSTMIGSVEYGTDVTIGIDASDPLNCYSISLPLEGIQELSVGGRLLLSDPGQGIIVAPSERQELTIAGNCRKLMVAIHRSAMQAVLEELLQRPLDRPLVFTSLIDAADGTSASWWRMVRHLWTDIQNPLSLYRDSFLSRDVEHALIRGFLLTQPHNYSEELQQRRNANIPAHLLRLHQLLMANAREDMPIGDLIQGIGVSRERLQADFKRHFGVTPLVFLRQYRLKQVHQEIVRGGSLRYVSDIALEWGFSHLGRFSQEYKAFFGELPSETARRNQRPLGR